MTHMRYCMDVYGSFTAYPWGTYREQLNKPHGRTQLRLMAYLWEFDRLLGKTNTTPAERVKIKEMTGWKAPEPPPPVPFDRVLITYGKNIRHHYRRLMEWQPSG